MLRLIKSILVISLFLVSQTVFAQDISSWAENIKSKHGGTKIVAAVASHPSVESFKKMIPKFEQLTGIDVVLDEMEEGQLGQKLTLEVSSGVTNYDMAMVSIERNPKVSNAKYTVPLENFFNDKSKTPSWFNYGDILPAYSDMFLWKGGHYAIPFAGETVFLFHRKDIFEKYNLTVPKTYAEVLNTAAFFDNNEKGVDGMSFRVRLGWEFTYTWSIFLFPFGGQMIDPVTGKPNLNTPGTRYSLNYMSQLAKHAPPGVESYSFPEAWDAFMLGKTAMMIEASAAAPEIENPEKSLVAGKVGYSSMPAGPAGAFSGVWGWGLAVTSASKHKEAAWAFIMYMTSMGMQDEYLANGGIPSRTSSLGNKSLWGKFPYYKATLETLKQAEALGEKGHSVVIRIPEWGQFSEMLGTDGARAFIGEIPVDQAVIGMQKQAEKILK